MNDVANIQKILERAGLAVRGMDDSFIYLEDPSCIMRGFERFLGYAWDALLLITVFLIMGWAFSLIRGTKNDIKENMKSLVLIFGILITSWNHANEFIFVDDINPNEILATKLESKSLDASLYEDIDIYDSGPVSE